MPSPVARAITIGTFSPPPPPAAVVYGTTQPGLPELIGGNATHVVSSAYNVGQFNSIPSSYGVCYRATELMSATFRANLRGDNGAGPQTTAVNTLIARWSDLNDVPNNSACPFHEPDTGGAIDTNNPTATPANIKAEMQVVLDRVKPILNNGGTAGGVTYPARTHPILFGPIFTDGMFVTTTIAAVRAWIPDGTDFVGNDPYVNLASWSFSAQVADAIGCPLLITEFGTSVKVNPPDTAPAGTLNHLQHMKDAINLNNNLTNPAIQIHWFDQNHNILDTNLTAGTAAGATSITVHDMPGKGSPYVWSFANGADITVDPHGPNPETVTTTSAINGSGNGPYTVPVTRLSSAHNNGAAVWLMPQSVRYWRNLT